MVIKAQKAASGRAEMEPACAKERQTAPALSTIQTALQARSADHARQPELVVSCSATVEASTLASGISAHWPSCATRKAWILGVRALPGRRREGARSAIAFWRSCRNDQAQQDGPPVTSWGSLGSFNDLTSCAWSLLRS